MKNFKQYLRQSLNEFGPASALGRTSVPRDGGGGEPRAMSGGGIGLPSPSGRVCQEGDESCGGYFNMRPLNSGVGDCAIANEAGECLEPWDHPWMHPISCDGSPTGICWGSWGEYTDWNGNLYICENNGWCYLCPECTPT